MHNVSDGCKSVCLSVNFYIFDFFSRTAGPILTKLGTNHPWGEGIQVCSNEGDCPSPRGDNSERVKIHWKFLKIFSRTSCPNSIKLDTHYPWMKEIQVCSNKGPVPLLRRDNYKNVKLGWGHFKIFFLKNYWPRRAEIYMKTSWHSTKSSLKNIKALGDHVGPQLGKLFLSCFV